MPSEFENVDISLRSGTIPDIGAMVLVLERANAQRDSLPLPTVTSDTQRIEEIHERMAHPGAWSHLVEIGGRLGGYVLGHHSSTESTIDTEPDTEYLAHLMMEPGFWGLGIGGHLLDAAAQTARDMGNRHMVLWTAESNTRARELYERKGYLLTEGRRLSSRQIPLVLYRLNLKS